MISVSRIVGWLVGLIGLALSLFTLLHLILMLSTQSVGLVNEDVPCCGRYLKPLLWNLCVHALFVLQHSVMSSDAWKMALSRVGVGELIHRPLYVICSCAVLLLIIFHSAVLPGPPLWYFDVAEYPTLWLALTVLHCLMWFVICAGAVGAQPMEFIGLKPLYSDNVPQKDAAAAERMNPRHVGVVAFIVILWVHMAMSVERFQLAMTWTLYVLFGHQYTPSAVYVLQAQKKQT